MTTPEQEFLEAARDAKRRLIDGGTPVVVADTILDLILHLLDLRARVARLETELAKIRGVDSQVVVVPLKRANVCTDRSHNRSESTRWCHDCRKVTE